jgi:hypothetical protein
MVAMPLNHLRSRIAWTSTCRLQHVFVLIGITESKVYNLETSIIRQ